MLRISHASVIFIVFLVVLSKLLELSQNQSQMNNIFGRCVVQNAGHNSQYSICDLVLEIYLNWRQLLPTNLSDP